MPRVGQEIVNRRTGQRMTFVELREELVRIDTVNPPGAAREPEHIHPKQESGAEVVSGSLVFEIVGQTHRVGPGEKIVIPPGTAHRFWNDGQEEAHATQWFRPGLKIAAFFETLCTLAREGRLDERGMPRPMQLMAMVPEFADEIRPTSPPWPVVRAAATVLAPVARLRGHRAAIARPY